MRAEGDKVYRAFGGKKGITAFVDDLVLDHAVFKRCTSFGMDSTNNDFIRAATMGGYGRRVVNLR